MPKLNLIAIMTLGSSFLAFSIYQFKLDPNLIEGEIDRKFIERLHKIEPHTTITIRSNGGYAKYGYEANEVIYSKELEILIDDYCFSACAEYLLLASKELTFLNEPLIGFHGNPLLHHDVLERFRTVPASECYTSAAPKLERLYKRVRATPSFRHEQKKRLIVLPVKKFINGCPQYKHKFVHKYWFPTSQQLVNYMGIEFEGTVCADNPRCVKERLKTRWKKGTTFVVGDEIVVSNGSD